MIPFLVLLLLILVAALIALSVRWYCILWPVRAEAWRDAWGDRLRLRDWRRPIPLPPAPYEYICRRQELAG